MTIQESTRRLTTLSHAATESDNRYVLHRRLVRAAYPGDALAADVAPGFPIFRPEKACTIKSITIIPGSLPDGTDPVLTAHDTDYKSISFEKEDTAGAGNVAAGTAISTALTTKITGGTGNWAQGAPEAVAGIDDTDTLAAGQTLFMVVTVGTDGVLLPDCVIEVDYELT